MARTNQHRSANTAAEHEDDTITVKREVSTDHDLAEEMNSTRVTSIKDEPISRNSTPVSANGKLKATSASSASTPKPKYDSDDATFKDEVDSDTPKLSARSRKAMRTSKKNPPRVAPLFDHLPDASDEANSAYSVIDSCTYQNKYLGYTEHAMECDCSEEWGESTTVARQRSVDMLMFSQTPRQDQIWRVANTQTASTVRQKWSVSGIALVDPTARTNDFGVAYTLMSQ